MRPRKRFRRHVKALARAHDIRLTWISDWEVAEAFPGLRSAVIPRIRSGGDYLICLHELGHILDPLSARHTDDPISYFQVLCEAAAWAWATASIPPAFARHLTPEDWAVAAEAFQSHLQYSASRDPLDGLTVVIEP